MSPAAKRPTCRHPRPPPPRPQVACYTAADRDYRADAPAVYTGLIAYRNGMEGAIATQVDLVVLSCRGWIAHGSTVWGQVACQWDEALKRHP